MSHLPDFDSTFSQNAQTVVVLKNVCKTYQGNTPILLNYSMSVGGGQVYGMLGSSGCGKSTVLSCIIGLQKWDSGTVTVFGENVRHGISTQKIGYMPQDYALYSQLTGREMFNFYAKLYRMSHTKLKERMDVLENLLNLERYGSRRIGTLSGGETRRISLALTLMHNPELIILDEPTVGLDPLLREKIWNYLFKLTREQKTTIIITTHYIEEVKQAHKIGIMRRGTLIAEDDPKVLMEANNMSLLEDVVLKLCKIDNLNGKLTNALTLQPSNSAPNIYDNRNCMTSQNDKSRVLNKPIEDILIEPFQRILAYNQVIWINFIRQPIFIILLILLPPMQLLTTGLVIGTSPSSNVIGIVNKELINERDNCSHFTNETCTLTLLSCKLIHSFNSSTYLKLNEFATEEKARLAVERGEIMGYLEIPGNYSLHLVERAMFGMYPENETIDDTIVAYTVITAVYDAFAEFMKKLSAECDIDLRRFDVPVFFRNPPVYGNKDVTVKDYMLPSLIICILFEVAFIAAPLVLINDMDLKMFDRSRVAGLQKWEMMSGIFLATATITVVQAIVCLISIEYLLGFHMQGSILGFILLSILTALCNSAFGLMIGVWLQDTIAIVLIEVFIFPILAIQSGVLQVLEAVPRPYRNFIFYFIPNVSTTTPLHWIMNRGVGLSHPMIWPGVLVTVGWSLAFTIVCAFLLRRL